MATKTDETKSPAAPKAEKIKRVVPPMAKAQAKAKAKAKAKPKAKAKAAPKKGGLVDKLIALLSSAKGATNEEAVKLGFKTAQSVRGTINGPVKKRHKVVVERDDKRGNVYRIKK